MDRPVLTALLICGINSALAIDQPHIIFILADDLGYNDVSWHNADILSPNLAQLAAEGVTLEQSYVSPSCTPSRSALMTGRYPFRLGRQHSVLLPRQPTGLTLNSTLLPERLRSAGYHTHIVGKWHLGNCARQHLPQNRGFDSFLGYWAGEEDYYNHSILGALDFWDGDRPLPEQDGVYSASVFSARAESIIASHDASRPLFLYLPFMNPHAPLQVPEEYDALYPSTMDSDRRTYSGMVTSLDDSVGRVVEALKAAGLYSNSVIVFVSDNGGEVHYRGRSEDGAGGSNYPLRGEKSTVWEGGTRTPAFVHSPLLERAGYVSHELIHMTDWLPTLLHLAGVDSDADDGGGDDGGLDGFNQWCTLSAGRPSPRREVVYNIDETLPRAALRNGDLKLVWGDNSVNSGWYPVPGTAAAAAENPPPCGAPPPKLCRKVKASPFNFSDFPTCLFNLTADPAERVDLSAQMPQVVQAMQNRLEELLEDLVLADVPDLDPRGDPVDGIWTTGWCEPILEAHKAEPLHPPSVGHINISFLLHTLLSQLLHMIV